MQKSKESGMITMSVSDILTNLRSNDALNVMYTIRYCVLETIRVNSVIEAIKALKNSVLIEWHTCSIADCAVAALDLLDVEHYTGEKPQIVEMITTRFYSDSK
ncbi:MAG: hypothetical protein IIV23_04275 [Ruminococcus sp.]|nr:hypothetical protein [Ruminococcus sp.]